MRGEKRLWKLDQILCALLMALIPIQLFLNSVNSMYLSDRNRGLDAHPVSLILGGIYLWVVLSAGGFMICARRLELSKFVGRYWLTACGALAVGALLKAIPAAVNGWLLFLMYTPYLVLLPFLDLLGIREMNTALAAVGIFCLCNWLICRCFVKKK